MKIIKPLLFLSILCSQFVLFGQTEKVEKKEIQFNTGYSNQFEDRGMRYLGSGIYSNTKVGGSGFVKLDKLERNAREEITNFCELNNYNYKIINVDRQKQTIGVFPKVIITYELLNKDGSKVMSKDEAKKELIELKEFLDLGIITQEEFDEKAVELKKILLGK
ncbi:hypothetical protein N8Z39_02190 [Cyclobacteriaceae bacterium]|nr:hypothetical protein [Cyclobacteriaceae bacterium]MDC1517515.1 hypothetical protein [Cyclobacteriaceae bacterium]|tara:strand:+ start:42 stop:530 length:489 start_codon:yes stop_codon:yes gene_type:complete